VLRTSVPAEALDAPEVVRAYKQLKEVERGFRTPKGPLELRPIHHRLEDRVKAHVFLCMLSYYLSWHLRRAWKPLLFDDEQPPQRPNPVATADRSQQAKRKTQTKRTANDEPCQSLETLLTELATRWRLRPGLGSTAARSGGCWPQKTLPATAAHPKARRSIRSSL
jgi:Transposase DDE domain